MKALIHKLSGKVSTWYSSRYYRDQVSISEDVIFVIGSARSGTTLLAEIINCQKKRRLIFEPFIQTYVKEWPVSLERLVLPKEIHHDDVRIFMDNLISGSLRNHWMDQMNPSLNPKGRIIKAVRANLMAAWIAKNYSNCKLIYIWRNPIEVIQSRIDFSWTDHLDDLLNVQNNIHELYPEIEFWLSKANTDVEKQALFWGLENKRPIEEMHTMGQMVISYHELIHKPLDVHNRINTAFKLAIPEKLFLKQRNVPSRASQTRKNKIILSPTEKSQIVKVLQMMELSQYLS